MQQNQTPDESQWLPLSAIATLLNLTPRRIQQLAQAGHIPPARKGRYALVSSIQGYCRYVQGLAADRGDTASAHAAEVLKQRAAKLRIENELVRDQFIPRRDVIVGMQVATDYICDMLLAIPAEVAPELLAAETVGEAKEILTEHVHAALDRLSQTHFVAVGPDDARDDVRPRRKAAAKTARHSR